MNLKDGKDNERLDGEDEGPPENVTVEDYLRKKTEEHISELERETTGMIDHFRDEATRVRTEVEEAISMKESKNKQ